MNFHLKYGLEVEFKAWQGKRKRWHHFAYMTHIVYCSFTAHVINQVTQNFLPSANIMVLVWRQIWRKNQISLEHVSLLA